MEEYGLANDNANYQGALESYQNDLITKQNLQAAQDREHDEAHEAWSLPVNVIAGDVAAKPIKTFLKGKIKNMISKGVKKGEQVVKDRISQAGEKLKDKVGDSLFKGENRPFQGTQSSLDEAYDSSKPLTGSADSIRNSVARLRQLTGGRDLGSGGEQVNLKDLRAPDSGASAPTPLDNPQPSASSLDDLRGEARVVNIGSENDDGALTGEQNDAVNAILRGEDPSTALLKYRMKTMDVPTAAQQRANIPDPDQPTDAGSQASRFQSRLDEINNNSATGDAGVVSEGNSEANSGNTGENLTGDADEAGKLGTDAVEDTAKVASKVGSGLTEGLEGAEIGADAAAAAEGGLNPFADLAALAVGIAGLFGANAPSPDKQVAYKALNPTIQHGI